MTIRFNCAVCGKQLRVGDKYAGRSGSCPHCGTKNRIPSQSDPALEAASMLPSFEDAALSEPEEPIPAKVAAVPRRYVDEKPDEPMTKPMKEIDHEDLIDMTAMVDIVFFLLIYFLVTSFQALSSTLPMPAPQTNDGQPQQAVAEADTSDAIEVRIDKDDVIWVENLRIEGQVELASKLRDLHESVAHPDKVQIIASGDASHGSSVQVMDSAKDAGLDKISITIDDDLASN